MAAPTLETNAGADTLRILDGTSGDPVTWNDVWDWDDGGGSSGGDGDVPKDGGGTAKVSTFMTETVADAVYLILENTDIGDGSTPSFFKSQEESVNYAVEKIPFIHNNATLQLGTLNVTSDMGNQGSYWRLDVGANNHIISSNSTASLEMYGSFLQIISSTTSGKNITMRFKTAVIRNSLITGNTTDFTTEFSIFPLSTAAWDLQDVCFANFADIFIFVAIIPSELIRIYNISRLITNVSVLQLNEIEIRNMTESLIVSGNSFPGVLLKNPKTSIEDLPTFSISTRSGDDTIAISEEYTVDITIRDKDGVALENVKVLIEDTNGNNVSVEDTTATTNANHLSSATTITLQTGEGSLFSINDIIRMHTEYMTVTGTAADSITVTRATRNTDYPAVISSPQMKIWKVLNNGFTTDANGQISQTQLPFKFWRTSSETEFDPAPYKFTFIKTGHLTIVMENITMDGLKDWELELLPGETIDINDAISVSENVAAQVVGLDTTIRFDTESRITRYDTVPV